MLGPPPAYSEAISSSCAFSSNGQTAANSNNSNEPPPIWTCPVPPPDIGERPAQFNGSRLDSLLMFGNMIESLGTGRRREKSATSPPSSQRVTPPPSYAESQGANPANGRQCRRCSREARRGENGGGQQSSATVSSILSPICSRHLHRCPSRHRHSRRQGNNAGNGSDLVFPEERPRPERSSSSRRSTTTIPLSGRDLENGIVSSQSPVCADRFRDLFLTILMRILLVFLFLVFMRILIAQLSPEE